MLEKTQNQKQIFHLNLKRKWFDMILNGEKKEEYREINTYWNKRFSCYIKIKKKFYHPKDVIICFSNGYSKNRDFFFVECEGLCVREGKKEWGAEPGKLYYVLRLGKIEN